MYQVDRRTLLEDNFFFSNKNARIAVTICFVIIIGNDDFFYSRLQDYKSIMYETYYLRKYDDTLLGNTYGMLRRYIHIYIYLLI